MSKREPIKTTIEEAVSYWRKRIYEGDLSVDWSEANTHCWRCGCERNLERCHIIPHSLGGKDDPSNIVLLCKRCHAEGPNVEDSEIMWDWIKAYRVPFYGTYWYIRGEKEYNFIYKKSFYEDIQDVLSAAKVGNNPKTIGKIVAELMNQVKMNASAHFGQYYFNVSTIAGMYRMAIKKLADFYGVKFPLE